MKRGRASESGVLDAKMKGAVRHVRFRRSDSGLECPQDLARATSPLTLLRVAMEGGRGLGG